MTHRINVSFDDKDAVKAKFDIKWNAAARQWHAADPDTAKAAQSFADELSGQRYLEQQEAAAAGRKAIEMAEMQQRRKVAAALESSAMTLTDAVRIEQLLARCAKQKFLLSEEETEFRKLTRDIAVGLGLENSTRNSHFDALAMSAAVRAAKLVLFAKA